MAHLKNFDEPGLRTPYYTRSYTRFQAQELYLGVRMRGNATPCLSGLPRRFRDFTIVSHLCKLYISGIELNPSRTI